MLRDLANPQSEDTVMPRSVARERIRTLLRPGLCDRQATGFARASRADLRAVERDAYAQGAHPWEFVGDYEFPHRQGSGPCCPYHPDHGALDPEACWRGLVRRAESRSPVAHLSSARETAQARARYVREGGDTGSAEYRDALAGRRAR